MDIRKGLHRFTRYLSIVVVLVLIGYALLVVLGRQMLPYLDRYRPDINGILSESLNIALTTERIAGSWIHLAPQIEVDGLCIGSGVDTVATDADDADVSDVACIEHVRAEPDLLQSILSGGLVWRNLSLGNIRFTVKEGDDGHWSLPSMPFFNEQPGSVDSLKLYKLINRLLLNKLINVEKLSVTLLFHSGLKETISFNDARLESENRFHRFSASLSVNNAPPSAELIIEGRGDISELDDFAVEGYLRLNRLNLSGSLNALIGQWYPELVERLGGIESEFAADIWFTRVRNGTVNLAGQISAEEIPLAWATDLPPVKNLRAQLTGGYSPGHGWVLRLQNLDFDWAELQIKPLNILFSQKVDAQLGQISIGINHLNLSSLGQILIETGLATGRALQIISKLNLRGSLNNLHMEFDFNKSSPLIGIRTQVEKLALNSWAGKPAVRDLSGYFEWRELRGFFDLESPEGFAVHYPGIYSDFMEYGSSSGRLNIEWQREPAALTIAGGPIRIDGEEGQIRAYLSLHLPFTEVQEPEMYLLVGIRNSHTRFSRQYIPQTLNPALLSWLGRSVGDMDILEGGFIWRGSLAKKRSVQRSIQVYAKVANGEVDYDPAWPKLTNMSAYITVDGATLNGVIGPAQLGNARLRRVVVKTLASKPGRHGTLLSVVGDLSSSLDAGANILLNSPLRQRVALFRDWQPDGQAEIHLDLAIPLTSMKSGAHYSVEVNIKDSRLSHRTLNMEFDHIKGQIAYSDQKGLYSSGISANFWGQEIDATIATDDGVTRLVSEGRFAISSLPIELPIIGQQMTGSSDYRVEFSFPAQGEPLLKFDSTLSGIEMDFPLPLNKSAAQIWPLAIEISFAESISINVELGEHLAATFRIKDFQLEGGQISLGEGRPESQLIDRFSLVGNSPVIDIDAWLDLFKSSTARGDYDLAALKPQFDMQIDKLKYLDFVLENIAVTGKYNDDGLDVYIDNNVLAGQVFLPSSEKQPIVMDLNYLVLPKTDSNSGESFLEQLEPNTLPHLNFTTGGLRIGEQEFGDISFLMRPIPDGVELTNIRGEIIGVEIMDLPDGEPATLRWKDINGVHTSKLTAMLKTYDLGAVLTAWSLPKVIDSKEAVSIADLSWPDKPWDIEVNKLTGRIALNYEKGKFFQAPGNTTNAVIKIIGLLNFDTWLRRLKLDFADLFSSGVSYDNLGGGLLFAEGTMTFDESIVVDLPSGKMRLTGQTDLVEETIDAHLVVTLPLGTNLPWMVALVGGLPAAAGVYLTSKVFKKQVDRVSSLSYKITGPWSEPEVEVDRIFSDKVDGQN